MYAISEETISNYSDIAHKLQDSGFSVTVYGPKWLTDNIHNIITITHPEASERIWITVGTNDSLDDIYWLNGDVWVVNNDNYILSDFLVDYLNSNAEQQRREEMNGHEVFVKMITKGYRGYEVQYSIRSGSKGKGKVLYAVNGWDNEASHNDMLDKINAYIKDNNLKVMGNNFSTDV
jgi:hypothetical protein